MTTAISATSVQRLKPEWVLYNERQSISSSTYCYQVTSGILKLEHTRDSATVCAGLVFPGQHCGEEIYLARGQHFHTARALTLCEVTRKLVTPNTVTALLSDVAERYALLGELLATRGTRARVGLIRSRHPDLHLTAKQLAELCGVSRGMMWRLTKTNTPQTA
jgi:CRP-like cAMP-binding protein